MNTAQLDAKFSRRLVTALRYDVGKDQDGQFKWVDISTAVGLIRHGQPDLAQFNRVTSADAQQPPHRRYFERKTEQDEESGWITYSIRAAARGR